MLCEVEVAAVRDPLELRPADRIEVFEIARGARVVRQLLGGVLADTQVAFAKPVALVPAHALVDPEAVPLVRLCRWDEVLHLHLLELQHAEEEVPGRDLVPEGLAADVRDPERWLSTGELRDVLEVDEDPLCRLGSQVGLRACLLHRADRRLEHQVELPWLRQVAVGDLARALRGPLAAADLLMLRIRKVVGSETELARTAVDERVGEPGHVPRGFPDAGVEDDRRVERDDVLALLHHRLEPAGAQVGLQQYAVVPVVVGRAEAAVDLRAREDEPAPACQRHDLVHRHGVCSCHGGRTLAPA